MAKLAAGRTGRGGATGMTADGMRRLIAEEVPLAVAMGVEVDAIGGGKATLRLPRGGPITRPGAMVSGPSMMAVADMAMYAAILGLDIADKPAVTSNFTMTFLRAAQPADIVAEAEIVRMGRRLIYLQTYLYASDDRAPIAHATGTYARPHAPSAS